MTTKRKKAKNKVWHIYHFRERFELPDNVRFDRQRPLVYTRDFVGSGQDDESINFNQQMDRLKSHPECLAIKGAFRELKTMAANRSIKYRGYLLDEEFRPATTKRLAELLLISEEKTDEYLKVLEEVRLIECVPLPDFEGTSPSEKTPKKLTKKRPAKKKAAKKKTNRKVKKATEKETSKNYERARSPLESNEKVKVKRKGKAKSEVEGKTENKKNRNEKQKQKPQPDRHPSDQSTRETRLKARTGEQGAQCDGQDDPQGQSTSTDSTDSTKADAPHGGPPHNATGPLTSSTKADAGATYRA